MLYSSINLNFFCLLRKATQSVLNRHICTFGKDQSGCMVIFANSLLPCRRQDPFGILYFSPFPRHKEVKPGRQEAAGGLREETSYKR